MKSPILDSIFNGRLRPFIYVNCIKRNDKFSYLPVSDDVIKDVIGTEDFYVIESDNDSKMNNVEPLTLQNLEKVIPFDVLLQKFEKLPDNLLDIENLCKKYLSEYVDFDFKVERDLILDKVLMEEAIEQEDIEIIDAFYKPNIVLEEYIAKNPFETFYVNIVKAEMQRLKLALMKYVKEVKSDVQIYYEVKNTLDLLLDYYMTCPESKQVTKYIVSKPEDLSEQNLDDLDASLNVFQAIMPLLYNAYFEIMLMFKVLYRNLLGHFKQMIFSLRTEYPSDNEMLMLESEVLIQDAQIAIKYNSNVDVLLEKAYELADKQSNKRLSNTVVALENYLVLKKKGDIIPSFKELTELRLTSNGFAESSDSIAKRVINQNNVKSKLKKTSVAEQMKVVQNRLKFLTGFNNRNQKIMKDSDYNVLIGLIKIFLSENNIPKPTEMLKPNLSAEAIRYTFYLLYNDINQKMPSRNDWISFIRAVFAAFSGQTESTLSKKFSSKPQYYDDDIKNK